MTEKSIFESELYLRDPNEVNGKWVSCSNCVSKNDGMFDECHKDRKNLMRCGYFKMR